MKHTGKLLYLCEDDLDLQDLLKDITENYKFTTIAHDNGKKCLESISKQIPDLIISDINMPEMTGVELLKRLYEMNVQIPVIFLTGETNPQYFLEAVAYNHFEFLTKPLDQDKFKQAIDKAMAFGFQRQELPKTVEKIKQRL